MDKASYIKKQDQELCGYENLCTQCGQCCGAHDSDPCANIVRKDDGKYSCRNYDTRLGLQKTVSGKIFNCVKIRDVIRSGAHYYSCAYMKK